MDEEIAGQMTIDMQYMIESIVDGDDNYRDRIKNLKEFSPEQIVYLTSAQTLDSWTSLSLEERLVVFKQRYPNSLVTVYKLRKLYKQYKIRKKVIRIRKIPTVPQQWQVLLQAVDLEQDIS